METHTGPEYEFYPGFRHHLPPKERGIKKALRRVSQLGQILVSPAFSREGTLSTAIDRYETECEIAFYEKLARWGFHEHETYFAKTILERVPENGRVLVVGCGSGREVFALKALQPKLRLKGIDLSQRMLDRATPIADEKGVEAEFARGSVFEEPSETYDFVWVTAALDSHMQGRDYRVRFYKELKRIKKQGAPLLLIPRIDETHEIVFHQKIGSQLLRLRWLGKGRWEKGDMATSFWGFHNDSPQMIYLHIYYGEQTFLDELSETGMTFEVLKLQDVRGWLFE